MIDADCHYGDHSWRGGGVCVRCGVQLRCSCGQFVREDGIEQHIEACPYVLAVLEDERRKTESTFAP